MENIQIVYIIFGILGFLMPFAAQYFWFKFELKQVRKDSEEGDRLIEERRAANVKALREIYDQKIMDSRNYAKGLFEQRADSLNNLQRKVDKIELKLDNMATIKSVEKIQEDIDNITAVLTKHVAEQSGRNK